MTTAAEMRDDLMTVYLQQWGSLRSFLNRRTGSRDLAEDALQETWLRLERMQGGGAAIKDSQAYVLRIAANIAIDLIRRERRHAGTAGELELLAVPDCMPSPETVAIDRDRLRQFGAALAGLPPKPRAALLMNRCDGLTHAEIARRLGVSESMVAKYLAQSLRHCRDHIRTIDG